MTDRSDEFDTFLREWVAERIVALGDRVDPSDREYMVKRRASELTALAREKALYSALLDRVRPGSVADYVRGQYESAEVDKRERDMDAT